MRPEFRETAGVLGGLVGGLLLSVLFLFSIMGASGFILALLVLALLPMGLAVVAFANPVEVKVREAAAVPAAAAMPAVYSSGGPAWRSVATGIAGSIILFALYLAIMSGLEGTRHTLGHVSADWLSIIGVVGFFGALAGAAANAARAHTFDARFLTIGVAGSIVGMVGLLACCTPLLIHVVPSAGILQASIVLMQNATLVIGFGIAVNLISSIAILRARPSTLAM